MVADLIEPAECVRGKAAVHDLHAEGHVFVFGVGFEPVQDGDAVIRTFGAIVDDGVQSLLDGVVKFFVDQPVGNGDGSGIGHGGDEVVLAAGGLVPILLT